MKFNIDHLQIKGRRAYGWGWIYQPSNLITSVTIVAEVNGTSYSFPCKYGLNRSDVAKYYGTDDAAASGFILSCNLPFGSITEFTLEVHFQDGTQELIDLKNFLNSVEHDNSRWIALIRRWLSRILDYLSRGDLWGLLRRMRIKIGNIWRQSKLRSGCAEDLLKLVRNPMQKDVVFVFDHNLGGGANLYREKRINEMRCAGERILLVYYDLPTLEYYIRYLEGAIEETFKIGTLERVEEIARFIKLKEIFFNNAFSFDDPLAIAILLPSLKNKTGAHLTIAVHDYFMICPSYTLLDYRGRFCGIPNLIQCQHCLSNSKGDFTLFVDCRNITEWRNAWGICLHEADTILCFSRSSVNLLMRAYPDLDETKFEIRPHSVEYLPRRDVFLDYQTPLNIGVVGRIAEHKGAGIIREMVKIIEEKNLPVKITIFGELEGSFSSPVLRVTGTYQREELPELIERARANLFFLPSICPETFSYVTEELMLMGVPLAVFDLGAPAERVRNYSKGLIIKEINARHALDQLIAFYARLRRSMPKGGSK